MPSRFPIYAFVLLLGGWLFAFPALSGAVQLRFDAGPPPAAGLLQPVEYFSYAEMMLAYCDDLPRKTYSDVAAEVPAPEKMLYLCDQAGILQAVKGEAKTLDAPEKFSAASSFRDLPFKFRDDAQAAEDGKAIEVYDVWYSNPYQFGMRIANYTKTPVSTIIIGFKQGECGAPGSYYYQKLMMVTANPIAPGTERLLKWKIPKGVEVPGGDRACMDVLRATP